MVIGGNRCILSISNPLVLMGRGMSLPGRVDPSDMDNVSLLINYFSILIVNLQIEDLVEDLNPVPGDISLDLDEVWAQYSLFNL